METQEMKNIYKWAWFALVVLTIFLGVQTINGLMNLRDNDPAYNSITVSGEGEVFAIPDLATFSLSVSADADTVVAAQGQVTEKMDAVLAAIKNLGIDDKDIKTTDYSVWPKYSYTPIMCTASYCPPYEQKPDGYTANHTVTVKVRNTDDAGAALALAGENGATNLSGISFTVDDPEALTNKARSLAIENAREKAATLAKELKVRLVRVVSFSDRADGIPIPFYREGLGGDMDVSSVEAPTLPTGENKVRVVVNITYEIR